MTAYRLQDGSTSQANRLNTIQNYPPSIKEKRYWREILDADGNNAQVEDSKGDTEGKRLRPRRVGDRKGDIRTGFEETTREAG